MSFVIRSFFVWSFGGSFVCCLVLCCLVVVRCSFVRSFIRCCRHHLIEHDTPDQSDKKGQGIGCLWEARGETMTRCLFVCLMLMFVVLMMVIDVGYGLMAAVRV
jgi:hypothetical protein